MKDKYIVYFVSKIKKKMTNYIEMELKKHDIKDLAPSHGNILTVLYENDGQLPMKVIAEMIGKDKSTVTALTNKLENLGYVMKVQSKDDKRVTLLKLRSKGKKTESIYKDISESLYERAYKNFTEEEKAELMRLTKKLNNNF